MGPPLWKVVGGAESGGIIVRVGRPLTSELLPHRLATGSLVEELELAGDRLHFRLRSGSGPSEGWASVASKGRELLVRKADGAGSEQAVSAIDVHHADAAAAEAEVQPPGTKEEGQVGEDSTRDSAAEGGCEVSPEAMELEGRTQAKQGEVAEAAPVTIGDWRDEVSRQRREGVVAKLAPVLLDAADALLKAGDATEALALAEEAVEQCAKLDSRWRLGVAWDAVAKARLRQLEVAQREGDCARPRPEERQPSHSHCRVTPAALAAASRAEKLLRHIGHPDEERDLASARATLAALRALCPPGSAAAAAAAAATEDEAMVLEDKPSKMDAPGAFGQTDFESCFAPSTRKLNQRRPPRRAARDASGLSFSIAGTWNNWEPVAMRRDGSCFTHMITVGDEGRESFQILANGRWETALYPSLADASPHLPHALEGPDDRGHGRNWTIGARHQDHACPGAPFKIFLQVDQEGQPCSVSWVPVVSAEELAVLVQEFVARGQLEEAAQVGLEAAGLLEELGSCPRQELGRAWDMVAQAHLSCISASPRQGGGGSGSRARDHHHALAVEAAGRALARLAGPLETSGLDDYASARCTLDKILSLEIERCAAQGDQEACAAMLQSSADVLLDRGALDCAAEVAKGAAMHYEKIGSKMLAGLAWDTTARAHIDLLWHQKDEDVSLASRSYRTEHARAGREAVAKALELLGSAADPGSEGSLASARCTSLRASALELCKGFGESWLALLRESRSRCTEALEKTFGYALGLERLPQYAKFDVRDSVCQGAGGFSHGQLVRDKDGNAYVAVGVHESAREEGLPRLWFQPNGLDRKGTCCFTGLGRRALRHALAPVGTEALEEGVLEDFDLAEDSEGELVPLCHECLLPLGMGVYPNPDGTGSLHGECMGQALLERAEADDGDRQREGARRKARDREEFGIGWKPERVVPGWDCFFAERGVPKPPGTSLCCGCGLVMEGGEPARVRLVRTQDPEYCVNLEYLAIALQARLRHAMAPYFSLDTPSTEEPWQVKTFDPPWLSSTCVGEILFQADYHLKELSIGDSPQPVVGMKTVWDFEWKGDSWRGREWFVVRDAKVFLSADGVLMPHVEMGVEARQQVADEAHRLVDAPLTKPDHPLVKYAEAFAHYFDLIAERKSVVYELREVSRASILAKFLVDNKVCLEDFWLEAPTDRAPSRLEIPLTKNERFSYGVLVCDGIVKEVQTGVFKSGVQLSGGVDLNLDAFDLSAPVRVHDKQATGRQHEAGAPAEIEGGGAADRGEDAIAKLSQRELRSRIQEVGGVVPPGPAAKSELIDMLGSLLRTRAGADEAGVAEGSSASMPVAMGRPPDGDMEEEKEFLLLEEELRKIPLAGDLLPVVLAAARRAKARCCDQEAEDAFWKSAGGNPETAALLHDVLESPLCDRRRDAGARALPARSAKYLESLRQLVREEREAQAQRTQHFFSRDFLAASPGPLFPTSWKKAFAISFGRGDSVAAGGPAARGGRLLQAATDAGPIISEGRLVFDKSTEDGTRFRVYRRGSREVRTTHAEKEASESVVAAFEICPAEPPSACTPVVKVSEFVRSGGAEEAPGEKPAFCYFLVWETDLGDAILAERRPDRSVSWSPSPPDLEDLYRRSRVLRAADCGGDGVTVEQVERVCLEVPAEALASSRRYARYVFEQMAHSG